MTRLFFASILGVAGLMAFTSTAAFAAGGDTSVAVSAGSGLTMSGATPGTFAATLNGTDQSVGTTLAGDSAEDTTGTGSGWDVTFQASRFTCTPTVGQCPTGGDVLPANSLSMAPPTVECDVDTSCSGRAAVPSIDISSTVSLDTGSNAVEVASAALNTGMGKYDFTPGQHGGTGNALALTVPSYAYATTYNSTLTVSLITGP